MSCPHLCETTKMLVRGRHLEKMRNVVMRKHEIVNGCMVSVDEQQRKRLHNVLQNMLSEQGCQLPVGLASYSGSSSPEYVAEVTLVFVSGTSTPVIKGFGLALTRPNTHDSAGSGSSGSSANVGPQEDSDGVDSEVTMTIGVPLSASLTPSHSLDPIVISYRICWSVLLMNLDGHTSKLCCSLPIHIPDYSLLDEACTAMLAMRRLLFGGKDAPREAGEEDVQLLSYPSHIHDRVAIDVASPEVHVLRLFAAMACIVVLCHTCVALPEHAWWDVAGST